MADNPKTENTSHNDMYLPTLHPLMPPEERLKVWERARVVLASHADEMLAHVNKARNEWDSTVLDPQ